LEATGQKDKAASLREVTSAQRRRDIVIRLSWQGEADLDLKVEEPTGSVCTWLNRQTVGGGTLIGDTVGDGRTLSSGSSEPPSPTETYVATEAFSGVYKVTVDRIWGRPQGNKARIDVIFHQGTPQEIARPITVELSQSTTVTVKLDEGRRTEAAFVPPPSAFEKSETPEEPEAPSVMRKLRTLTETGSTVVDGGMKANAGAGSAAPTRRPAPPKGNTDEIVYQTKVAPFVVGSSDVTAQAIISADRRYVRLSLSALSSGIGGMRNQPIIQNPLIPGLP
jgi:hypothetical protein